MAAVAAQPVFRLLGAKGLGVSDDYHTEVMPGVNVGMLDGQLAWRQHDGGHTDAPNVKYFIQWADKFMGRDSAPGSRGAARGTSGPCLNLPRGGAHAKWPASVGARLCFLGQGRRAADPRVLCKFLGDFKAGIRPTQYPRQAVIQPSRTAKLPHRN
jgi:hypothetical protein